MKTLIIGSKGFIGNALQNYLQQLSFDVLGCDIINDYTSENYYQIDATNSDFHELFTQNTFQFCINCSGAASVPPSFQNPLKDFTLNTYNVVKILDAIKNHNKECKFINLSSAAVYGNPIALPISEKITLKPISPYGIHKFISEKISEEYHQFFQLKICNLRIFSAYGNGLKKQLFWDLYKKFQDQQEPNLFGTGNESRDFIHVDDICQAIHLVMQKATFKAEAINIANGTEIYIKDIATIVKQTLESDKKIVFNNDVKIGDPTNWRADITKLKSFGYIQKININQGIKSYIKWALEEKN